MHKPNRSFAKKVFAAGLATSTALLTAGSLLVPYVGAVEAHPEGSLVVSSGTVWHVFSDGGTLKRHGVDSLEKFNSHRWSFAHVVPANSADLALADAGLMPWGSGVLFNDGGTVYQVAGGTKHGFTSAGNFTGNGFSFSNVVAGSLSGLSAGAVIDNVSAAHMEGTFVVSGGTVWTITATGRKGVPSPAVLRSHGADFKDVVSANAADLALANEGNASFRPGALVNDSGTIFAVTATTKRGFPTASCFTGFGFSFANVLSGSTSGLTAGANFCAEGDTGTPSTGPGTLTVTLASDTPAAATIVKNSARVGFAKVNLVASGGDVTVDSMTVRRTGVSLDSNFTDILLLDMSGGKSVALADQIGNEKSLGSTHEATFGDDIVVKNGTTKVLMIAANMAGTLQAADQAKLELIDVKVAGSATLSASLPIAGNTMTMNNNVAIATVTVANGGQNPSASTQNVGVQDYVVSSLKITIGSQEDVKIHRIRFFQNGTAADGDVKDAEVLVDGAVIGTLAKPKDKVLDFVFATPVTIAKGNNKDFNLRLDIADGSSRTISFDIDKKADIVAEGLTYGYFRVPSYDNSTAPFYNAPNTTIDVGTITFSKGVLSSLNVGRASSQALGAFKVTVQGEAIRVTQLVIGVAYTGGVGGTTATTTNFVVKDSAGKALAGPVSPSSNANNINSATSTDTVIFPVGTNTYTVFGDVASATDANSTVVLRVSGASTLVTAKGEVTNQTITPGPTADVTLDTVTIKGATLAVSTSTSPAAQSVVIGKQDFVFANIVVDASNSGEDVRVNQLAVLHKTSANSIQTNLTNLEVVVDGVALAPIVQPTAVAATTATSTFSFSSPIVVTKGTSKTLSVRGDVNAGSAAQTHSIGCASTACITAVGSTTGNSVTPTVTNSDGQVMNLQTTGTMTLSGDSTTPDAGFLVGGAEKVTVQVLTISAAREAVDLTELHFEPTAVNGGELNDEFLKVYLFDGATQIASITPTTTAAVTFASIPSGTFRISGGSSKTLTVKVDVGTLTDPSNPSSATADSGDGVTFVVPEDAYNATGVDSGSKLNGGSVSGTHTANAFSVYKSVPTVTKLALPTGTLVNTTGVVLYKFKVTADAKGKVGLYKFSFAISTTTATVTQFEVFEEPDTTSQKNLTTNATRSVGAPPLVNSTDGKSGQYFIDVLFDTDTEADTVANGGEFVQVSAGASKTYQLTGTVTGSVTGSSVSVVMRGDNAFVTTYPNCAGGASAGNSCTGISDGEQGKFVWSDLAFASASSSATNTLEWFNGFRVPGMITTSSALILSR